MLLERLILKLWYPRLNNKPIIVILIFFLKIILLPLALIYKLIIDFKKKLYKKNILTSYKFNVPVIVIGNITVGGTGKTTVVMGLAKILLDKGYKPGIILRGYKSSEKNNNQPILITEQTSSTTSVNNSGDEARLIFNNTNCPVAVSKNRVEAAKLLLKNNLCNIILSDDGMQHYKLARDLEICVVDSQRLFGNNFLLPAGPLREEISRLKSVDYILVKNYDSDFLDTNKIKIKNKNRDNVFNFNFNAVHLVNIKTSEEIDLDVFRKKCTNKTVYAISAIGNNDSFINLLYKLNFKPRGLLVTGYPDHYCYKLTDFYMLDNKANLVITTEKDAVKIKDLKITNSNNIFYLKIAAVLPKEFLNDLFNKINKL